jgi:hypothetical protein
MKGRNLLSFKVEAAGFVGFFVLVVLGPLVMFTPVLQRAKQRGGVEYGLLANRYVFGFEDKWLRVGDPETSKLLGTVDIQSLSDLDNVYSAVRQMRLVPFGTDDITRLAVTAAAPLLPLALTIFSVGDVAKILIKILVR